ncbi:MAG: small ribosomal subunit Rsm22 family protein [Verrucomicrobiota bacterium]
MNSSYPTDYELYWLKLALRHFKTDDKNQAILSLEPAVRYLSDQFTTKRSDDFAHYSEDPELLLAYGMFFFPQTYARVRFPLEEIARFTPWRPKSDAPFKILDLGCGLGAASLSIADYFSENSPHIVGWDQSPNSLRHFESIARDRRLDVHTHNRDIQMLPIKVKPHTADVVVMSFSLNELFETKEPELSWLESLWKLVNEDGLLLIMEPALHQTPVRLEKIREFFRAQHNAQILAPCLHSEVCPLLTNAKMRCHEVREWTPPESLKILNRSLFREISIVKFSFLAIQKAERPKAELNPRVTRMISPMLEENGKTIFHGCSGDGIARRHEIMHRHLSKQERHDLLEIQRGTRLQLPEYEIVGKPPAFRVKNITP